MDYDFAGASGVMLLVNLVYAVVALLLGIGALKWIDSRLLKKIDLEQEIQKGNIAAAIFASSLLLFVALIISHALGR
jgi:uncharacterized membrane protein YjfL (UPF0719 family)